jgi:ATP-dependent Clp protease ATP-binding subunit ClpA
MLLKKHGKKKQKIIETVTEDNVAEVVSMMTGIPVNVLLKTKETS